MKPLVKTVLVAILLVACLKTYAVAKPETGQRNRNLQIFDETIAMIESKISDQSSKKWAQIAQRNRNNITNLTSERALKELLKFMLAEVGLPRSSLLNQQDQNYWIIKQTVTASNESFNWGVRFRRRGNRWFISHVFPNTQASKLGLKRGDELITLKEGTSPLTFSNKTFNGSFRSLPWSSPIQASIKTIRQPTANFLVDASRRSLNFFKTKNEKSIAYLRLWMVHDNDSAKIAQQLLQRALSKADIALIDLRDAISIGKISHQINLTTKKPIAIIVNNETGAYWESFVSRTQIQHRTVVMGSETQGQYLNPKYTLLGQNKWLLVIPRKHKMDDFSNRKKIIPDITLDDPLVYSGGQDPSLENALELTAKHEF